MHNQGSSARHWLAGRLHPSRIFVHRMDRNPHAPPLTGAVTLLG
jgi:hypothetical protein